MKTLRVSLPDSDDRLRNGFTRHDEGQRDKPLGSRMTKFNALRELQSASGEEMRRRRTLMPSVLDRALRGEVGKDLTGFRDTFPDTRHCPRVSHD